jgi:hypothetical protein
MSLVLGIDPGPVESAWVLWDGSRVVEHGKQPNVDVLDLLDERADIRDPILVAIEMMACYGMAVGAETLETCVWIGRYVQAWSSRVGDEPMLLYRMAVKMHLCHDSRAKDGNIRQALIDRLGAPGTKKAKGPTYGIHKDEWSALAIAITAAETKAVHTHERQQSLEV